MKRVIIAALICLVTFMLAGCTAGRSTYPSSDLAHETWRQQIQTDSDYWALKADRWFREGGPTAVEVANQRAPYSMAMAHTTIRVPNFSSLAITGDFQIQISDERDQNKVWIEGPSNAVRAIVVTVRHHILCLEQIEKAPANMGRVIVHIGMKQLRSLVYKGNGRVEGIRIFSDCLTVESSGCGDIFLAGHINVKSIISRGEGSINIFTLYSDGTSIGAYGAGAVNVSAKQAVVLNAIKHDGTGNINIIGAQSPGLVVNTKGRGKIGISGRVMVKEISARGDTCVFIASAVGGRPCVYVYDNARVGIDGAVDTLYGYTSHASRLMARYLLANKAYVEASGTTHINVYAREEIFARAKDNATIYFFGDPAILTAFEMGHGSIVSMRSAPDVKQRGSVRHRSHDYKDEASPRFSWREGRLVEV